MKKETPLEELRWFISDGLDNYDEGVKVSEIWDKLNDIMNFDKWISCDVALPENEGEYLTYYLGNDSQSVQYFDGQVWGYLSSVPMNVTHWKHLPPNPNQ